MYSKQVFPVEGNECHVLCVRNDDRERLGGACDCRTHKCGVSVP